MYKLSKVLSHLYPNVFIFLLSCPKHQEENYYLKNSIKVLDLEVRWKFELVTDVITPFPCVRHVHCEDQGLVAEALDAVNNVFRQLSVPIHIELEPAVAIGSCCYNLLH